jgi:hypothetical protein
MAKVKQTRKDAGAKKKKPKIPVQLPNGSTADLHSTARLRKKLRKKRRKTMRPGEGA